MITKTKSRYNNIVFTIDKDFFNYSIEFIKGSNGIILTNKTNHFQCSIKESELKSTQEEKGKRLSIDSFIDFAKSDNILPLLSEISLTSTEAGIQKFRETLPKSFFQQ